MTIENMKVPNPIPRGIIPNLGRTTLNMLWSLNCWARSAMMVYCNLMVMMMVVKISLLGSLGNSDWDSEKF